MACGSRSCGARILEYCPELYIAEFLTGEPDRKPFGVALAAGPSTESPHVDAACHRIYDPILAHSLASVQLQFDSAIASLRARREDLDHDIGRASNPVIIHDATSRGANYDDVGLDSLAGGRKLDTYGSVQHDTRGRVVDQRIQ